MRLTAIKLAGFKSFVDPTTLNFTSNITGVVGPNGCGKSNIIDAVRWVMGESSARQLRGQSMTDVIFSGSRARKAVGKANVELIFDNSDGRASGEYAAFSEISVRRQITRDATSSYFLNGTRCRRKDITDLFLGTGMGPRSYSIIEQGMISQVVEARPEELRQYLEEAAGISKYRERRRETENRIKHTRENLDRLNDLREEVGKHLDKLKRQANAAERYKKLQVEKRELDGRLLALQWRELQAKRSIVQEHNGQFEVKLEQAVATQRHAETGLELMREQQTKAQEHLSTVQAELYQVGASIAQTEQSIKHQRELRERQEREQQDVGRSLQDLSHLRTADLERIDVLQTELTTNEPQLHDLQELLTNSQQQLQHHQQQISEQQKTVRAQLDSGSQHSQQTEVLRTRIQHLDEQQAQEAQRLTRLREEQQRLDLDSPKKQLEEAIVKAKQSGESSELLQEQTEAQRSQLDQQREQVNELQRELQQQQQAISADKGRLHSLHALQQAALGEDDKATQVWLQTTGLEQHQRLAETLDAPKYWATAIETVLGDYLQAVVVDDVTTYTESLAQEFQAAESGGLTLITDQAVQSNHQSGKHTTSLAEHITAPAGIQALLSQILCADSLTEALAMQDKLSAHQSVVTPTGEWLGKGWVRIHRGDNPAAGSLRRQQEIRELEQQLTVKENQVEALQQKLEAGREQRSQLENQLEQTRQQHNQAHYELSQAESACSSIEKHLQTLHARSKQIEDEFNRLTNSISEHESGATNARGQLQDYIDTLANMHNKREQLEQQLREQTQAYEQLRDTVGQQQAEAQQLAIGIESRRASLTSLQESRSRADQQYEQLQQRSAELTALLEQQGEPGLSERETLEQLLEQQLTTEQRLKDARSRMEELAEQLRKTDAERQQAVISADGIRQELEQARLRLQELQLRADNLNTRLQEIDNAVPMEELVTTVPEGASSDEWQQQSEKLEVRIRRLEPVNLAAISEFEKESERKTYLDNQDQDLQEALETLEKAIARIDRTTRTRFKETFEKVRAGMDTLFPRLFGGGHAYLELTGDDLLTTGVSIMASPPGKRVSSIHLLSGGEKALTAAAFVFAIFGLNPAPFCMLDEVDAPLDDANVSRFSKLVKEMSEQVQFIVVTHNKVTMEMTDQLAGVTMREAGVSRLVTVDIEQAAELAAS